MGKKINELTEITEVPSSSYILVDDGTLNNKVTKENLMKDYLPLTGGSLSGNLKIGHQLHGNRLTTGNTQLIGTDVDSIYFGNVKSRVYIESSVTPLVRVGDGTTYGIYHTGNKPKPADIGAATSGHTHKSLELSGNNTISLTDDTTTKWGAQKNSIHYYSTTGKLTNQPGQYGILCNFTNGDKEVHQLWLTQNHGNILHRGGNAEGWNTASWLTLLDTGNYSNYAFPKAGGTLTGKITFQDQLGGGGLNSLINCNALQTGTGNGQLITAFGNHIYMGNPKTPITIEGNTHPKVNVNGTEYTMYHTGNKPSPADIGAAASGHVHHQVESLGNVTAETGANHPSQPGLSMRHVYNNGYPVPYGNVITMRGAGSNQILTEWSGSDGGAGRLYIRNKRDTSGDWSSWAQVYTSAHKPSPADIGAAASNHTHDYAASNHTHDYAASNHTHNYAAASHNHGLMHSDLGVTIANTSTDSGWSMINGSYNGYILKSIRSNQYAPAWHLGNYSAGICFGGADTKGVLSCSYDHAEARFAGGNGSKPVWWFGLQGKSGTTYNLDSFNAAKWGGYTVRTGAGATGVAGAITFSW